MAPEPTIPNVIAQIAISGRIDQKRVSASERKTIEALKELGLSEEAITPVIDRAVSLGVVRRTTDQMLIIE